jgi:adenylosuccinate synthase
VTKLDVLARLPEAKLCVSYADGLDPGVDDLDGAEPVYKTVIDAPDPALLGALRKARTLAELPTIFRQLLDEIEETVGVPVVLVSCGPDRSETILVGEPFG